MTKPKKVFIVMLSALVASVLLTGGGLYMADRYLADQAETISDLRADDEILSVDLINSQRMREELKKYSYLDEVSDEILPDTKNQSEAILLINTMGKDAGINIDSYSFISTVDKPGDKTQTEQLKDAPDILTFPITVKFTSSYSQIISWLELAEKNQRKMQVSSVNITPSLDDDGNIIPSRFVSSIVVNAYVEK